CIVVHKARGSLSPGELRAASCRYGPRRNPSGCQLEKRCGCSCRVSPYLNLGHYPDSQFARAIVGSILRLCISPSSMSWGVHLRGTGLLLGSRKVSVE